MKNRIHDLTNAPMCKAAIKAVDDLCPFIGADVYVHRLELIEYRNGHYSSRFLFDVTACNIREQLNATVHPSEDQQNEIDWLIIQAFVRIRNKIISENTKKVLFEKFRTI